MYGTTEVSCWAMCHLVSGLDTCSTHHLRRDADVEWAELGRGSEGGEEEEKGTPLGTALLGTQVEVRDVVSGRRVDYGSGEIWLGKKCVAGNGG